MTLDLKHLREQADYIKANYFGATAITVPTDTVLALLDRIAEYEAALQFYAENTYATGDLLKRKLEREGYNLDEGQVARDVLTKWGKRCPE
jgi:hypothetical protein